MRLEKYRLKINKYNHMGRIVVFCSSTPGSPYPAEGMTALAHGGFYGLCLDTRFGGHGQGPATFAAVIGACAR
jgi:hypothetical protein